MKISEILVVEGREDTANIKRYFDVATIETHGYGISRETWIKMDRAYKEPGLIIFTDPDHAGKELRRKLTEKYPEAKQAFLEMEDCNKKGDVGIEHGSREDIEEALKNARSKLSTAGDLLICYKDLVEAGLAGGKDSKNRRRELGKVLSIGYGNSKSLLGKLKDFGIKKGEFDEAVRTIDNKRAARKK